MKQKIVVKVQMKCQKCRTKAFEIAASSEGVEEVRLEGESKDRVVVIGEEVDFICLVESLRKKVGQTDILIIEEVKSKQKQKEQKQKEQEQKFIRNPIYYPDQCFQYHHPSYVVYDQPPGYCCIM